MLSTPKLFWGLCLKSSVLVNEPVLSLFRLVAYNSYLRYVENYIKLNT